MNPHTEEIWDYSYKCSKCTGRFQTQSDMQRHSKLCHRPNQRSRIEERVPPYLEDLTEQQNEIRTLLK
jgi:DNA-directed RNA polymerase subunit RPC12/RpoP